MDVDNKPKYYGLCKNCDIPKCNNNFENCIYTIIDPKNEVECKICGLVFTWNKKTQICDLCQEHLNQKEKQQKNKGIDKWLNSV